MSDRTCLRCSGSPSRYFTSDIVRTLQSLDLDEAAEKDADGGAWLCEKCHEDLESWWSSFRDPWLRGVTSGIRNPEALGELMDHLQTDPRRNEKEERDPERGTVKWRVNLRAMDDWMDRAMDLAARVRGEEGDCEHPKGFVQHRDNLPPRCPDCGEAGDE